ncbi:MAG: flavin monoamine oxidase family protein [Dehalococcoidia bacterium]
MSTPSGFDWDAAAILGSAGKRLRARDLEGAAEAIEEAVEWAESQGDGVSLAEALAATAGDVAPQLLEHVLETELAAEFGASAAELSAKWALAEGGEGDDLLVTGGYGGLASALATGTRVTLSQPVERVALRDDGVEVTGPAGFRRTAGRVVATAPLGVLAAGKIRFEPELPATHREALGRLKMGLLDKLWLRFEKPFWKEPAVFWTLVAPRGTPYREWINLEPLTGEPVLLGLNGGDTARAWASRSDAEHEEAALAALRAFLDAGW